MLKVAMIGMGGISKAHRDSWKNIPEAEVVAVCDIRPEKALSAAQDMNAHAYYSYEEMESAEAFDILDICLPTFLHADYAVKALESGKHVLCEKPISLKIEDVRRVYAAAEKAQRSVMIAQVVRFMDEYKFLRNACLTNAYGKLLSGHMTRMGATPKSSWDHWMQDPARSGMVPFDLHIHDLDFIIYTFGAPKSMNRYRAGNAKQDYFEAVYQYPDFFISAESAWFDCEYRFQCAFRFQFENAVVEFKDNTFTIYHKDGRVETPFAAANGEGDGYIPKTNAYFEEIRYFTNCVLKGKPADLIRPDELETVLTLIEKLQ